MVKRGEDVSATSGQHRQNDLPGAGGTIARGFAT